MDTEFEPVYQAVDRRRDALVYVLVPLCVSLTLMVLSFALSRLVHYPDDAGWTHNGSLSLTMGEFRELLVYYLGFLYVGGIWLRGKKGKTESARALQHGRTDPCAAGARHAA